eukprot:1153901-Pelagomonas_calceolata.AAC.3
MKHVQRLATFKCCSSQALHVPGLNVRRQCQDPHVCQRVPHGLELGRNPKLPPIRNARAHHQGGFWLTGTGHRGKRPFAFKASKQLSASQGGCVSP